MIKTRKGGQEWSIGAVVKVGFMSGLRVLAIRAEFDGMPDIYTLESENGRVYEFVPHNGLTRIK